MIHLGSSIFLTSAEVDEPRHENQTLQLLYCIHFIIIISIVFVCKSYDICSTDTNSQ